MSFDILRQLKLQSQAESKDLNYRLQCNFDAKKEAIDHKIFESVRGTFFILVCMKPFSLPKDPPSYRIPCCSFANFQMVCEKIHLILRFIPILLS